MSHISAEQWQRYIDDNLEPEERDRCEAHVSVCDLCLERYMQCLEQAAERLPLPEDEAAFTAAAMKRFDEHREPFKDWNGPLPAMPGVKSSARQRLLHHPFFHYAVAAVITLILMGSGVFHTITQQIAYIEPDPANTAERADASYSKIIMDHTVGLLDSIQPKRERGDTP